MDNRLVSYSSVLGLVVANKRKELGIEQGDMAIRIGLSQASYSRLESGKSTFSVDQLFECAESLNVPVEQLFSSVANTVRNLRAIEDVFVTSQPRGNTTKAKKAGCYKASEFTAGPELGALIFGLAGKSR